MQCALEAAKPGNQLRPLIIKLLRAPLIDSSWSCRQRDARTAKYELTLCQRTHLGADDRAFRAIAIEEDAEGEVGPNLKISVLDVAAKALRCNILAFATQVLPIAEAVRPSCPLSCPEELCLPPCLCQQSAASTVD